MVLGRENITIFASAIKKLTDNNFMIADVPSTEEEFGTMVQVIMPDGTTSSDVSNFGVTWADVSAKYTQELSDVALDDLRQERNAKLAETDWVVTMHKELGTNIPAAWKTYRQALRDITDNATSLDDVTWPEKP